MPGLSIGAKLGLVAFAGISLVPLGVGVGLCLLGLTARRPAGAANRESWPKVLRWLCVVAIFSFLLTYASSWGSFYAAGTFLNLSGVALARAAPGEFVQHTALLAPWVSLAVLVVAVAVTLGFAVAAPRLTLARRQPLQLLTLVALAGIAVCAVGVSWSDRAFGVSDDQARTHAQRVAAAVAREFVASHEERTGPVAHLVARAEFADRRHEIPSEPLTVAVRRPEVRSAAAYAAASIDDAERRRWNVIILVVESLRSDRLTMGGGRRVVMPNVEALARESRVFPQAVTNATHSNYASVVAVSGQYPLRSTDQYIYDNPYPYPRALIYDLLKALRYHTAVMSSQNETWGGMYNFLESPSIDQFVHAETFKGPTYVPQGDDGFADFVSKYQHAGKIDDRLTVGAAVSWIDSLRSSRGAAEPFFMYMNLQSSHVPYFRPPNFPPRFGSGRTSFLIGFNHFPRDSAAAVMDMYDNSLAYADAQIGRLVEYLKDHRMWDSTILVLTGDHGQAFYEHGFAAHGELPFAELARVPIVVHAPNLAPGVDERPAQHVDIAPTILDLLGLPPHPAYQGVSLIASSPDADRPLFTVAQTGLATGYGIVEGRYALIADAYRGSEVLFDDARDPGQTHDLSDSLPVVRRRLQHNLDMWREVQLRYYLANPLDSSHYCPTLRF